MGQLDDVDLADLHAALETVTDDRATLRICVGIAYLHGVGPTELAEWFGVSRATIYDWLGRLARLDESSAAEVLVDAERPGRPPKLSGQEREQLLDTVSGSPADAGYDAEAWTPDVVRRHVRERFGIEYSRRHVRDLLHDLGFAPGADGAWHRS